MHGKLNIDYYLNLLMRLTSPVQFGILQKLDFYLIQNKQSDS